MRPFSDNSNLRVPSGGLVNLFRFSSRVLYSRVLYKCVVCLCLWFVSGEIISANGGGADFNWQHREIPPPNFGSDLTEALIIDKTTKVLKNPTPQTIAAFYVDYLGIVGAYSSKYVFALEVFVAITPNRAIEAVSLLPPTEMAFIKAHYKILQRDYDIAVPKKMLP